MTSAPADTVHLSFPEAPSLAATVDYLSRVLTGDGDPVAPSNFGLSTNELSSREAANGECVHQIATWLQFLRSGLTLAASYKELAR